MSNASPSRTDEALIGVVVIAVLFGFYAFNPAGDFDAIAAFVQAGVALVAIPAITHIPYIRTLSGSARIIIGSILTIAVLLLVPIAVNSGREYLQGRPGRAARASVEDWTVVLHQTAQSSLPDITTGPFSDDFVDGFRQDTVNGVTLGITSRRDATTFLNFTSPVLQDFFISTTVTKERGPVDSHCGIIFGYQDNDHWYFFRIREDQFASLSNDKGGKHVQLAGPDNVSVIKRREPNTLMILARDGRYQFFINNIEVYNLIFDNPIPTGTLDFAVQTPALPGAVTCTFSDTEIRTP